MEMKAGKCKCDRALERGAIMNKFIRVKYFPTFNSVYNL